MAGPSSRTDPSGDPAVAWARSGASMLSGPPPGGRLGPPARLVPTLRAHGGHVAKAAARWDRHLLIDWLALLGERAALDGLVAGGRTSCGGATRLLRCADGWVAVALARPSDVDLLPAWLALAGGGGAGKEIARAAAGRPPDEPDRTDPRWQAPATVWAAVGDTVARCDGAHLADAAGTVGLPVGVLGERRATEDGGVRVHDLTTGPVSAGPPARVVDLSTLWAGPLCASLLADCGAEVVKVVTTGRPDGAAAGHPEWYRLLNGAKAHLEVDLSGPAGRARLAELVAGADVVVESARPRGLEQLGIVAAEVLGASDGPRVWVSITGHGRTSPRVAFGDDAAVAGGLVVEDDDGPWFCGDAIADPLSGVAAAAAALDCLSTGRRALVEVSMAGVAAAHAGPTCVAAGTAAAPRARSRSGPDDGEDRS